MPDKMKKTLSGHTPGDIVPGTMFPMSLTDRAKLAALAELNGGDGVRDLLLGAVGQPETARRTPERSREVPCTWTMVHVLDRLEEAFEVLSATPAKTRPKQFGNGMPTPIREKMTNKDWIDWLEAGELEKIEQDRNRVRLSVTAAQISRMDQALRWPVEYLAGFPEVSRALCLKALWSARGTDIGRRCKALGMNQKFFHRQWQHGLTILTMRLIADRVPVS